MRNPKSKVRAKAKPKLKLKFRAIRIDDNRDSATHSINLSKVSKYSLHHQEKMMSSAMRFAGKGARRMLSTEPKQIKFPEAGQSHGGHSKFLTQTPTGIREKMMFFKAPEVWPLVACLAFALSVGTWKSAHMDMKPSKGPWATFFGANNRAILGITPSDSKLEYKKKE